MAFALNCRGGQRPFSLESSLTPVLCCPQKDVRLWLVWLSGLSAGLRTKGSPVRSPVRAHAWVAGQVPGGRHVTGNHTWMFLSLFLPPFLSL